MNKPSRSTGLQILRTIKSGLLSAMAIQGICFMASFPIIFFWGLQTSSAALLCNIAFGPASVLFLFLAALMFVQSATGIFIPGFPWLFDNVCLLWMKTLGLTTLVPVLFVPSWTDFIAWAVTGILMLFWARRSPAWEGLNLAIWPQLLTILCLVRPLLTSPEPLELTAKSGGRLTVELTPDGELSIRDNGYFGRQSTRPTLVNTVRPEILKHFGARRTKNFFCCKGKKSKSAGQEAKSILRF